MRVLRTILFAVLFAATAAHAVPTTYDILLDLDNLASTGCTVTGTWGSFAGIEERLVVSVNTTGPATAIVDKIERQSCTTPPSTFGPISPVDPGDWPVGIGNGTLSQNVIEAYYPLPAVNPPFVRFAVVARDAAGAEDAILTTTPTSGLPLVIQLASVVEIPTLSGLGFLALGILLALMAMVLMRRRARGVAAVIALLALGSAAWGITCVLDGQTTEWTGIAPLGTDSGSDGTQGSEVVAVFAAEDPGSNHLCFRIDGSLQFNAAPVANDQSPAAANEDTAQPLTLTGSDPDSDPLTFTIVTPPANGVLSALTGATATSVNVTYTPNANFAGADSFVFQVADGLGGTDTGTVSLTVTPIDDAPVAVNDAATVNEDSGANAVAVLANDTDPDAGPISITAVTQGANGTVAITGGGTGLTYAPNANYCNNPPGTTLDTFTYTLTPGGTSATVTMTVTCVDDAPVAVADAATVTEDSGASAVPVLANDTDVDAGPISIASVTQPANGAVAITGGGTGLTYAPNANYCNNPPGTTLDTFTYNLTPGGSSTTVTMTVTCVDDNPVAVADAATVAEDSSATAVTVLANDTDVDGGAISITSVTQPANGTVVITGGGTGLTYQPNADYCNNPPGTTLDTFTYTLTPGGSSTTVTMTVTCVDDNPVAVADAATVAEDSGANAINVLANDTDVDAGPKSVASVTQPANGAVVITGGGTGLTYQPNANYCNNPPGTTLDTFTYTLTPGSSSTTVTMTVTCLDDPPVAVADAATVNEDSGANAVNVLANDTDVDAGPKSVFSVTQPANGAVVITGGGTGLTYAPNANYCNNPPGTTLDTFTYTLTPGGSSATVTMTVTCLNDGPAIDLDADDSGGTAGANYAITFTEGDAATLLEDALDATVTDVDNATLASLTVTLTNLFDTGFEILSTDVTGTSITAGYVTVPGAPGTGTLTLTGPDTLANFETVLRKVKYVNTDTAPDATARVVNFVANDGTTNGNTAVSTVTVVAVDSPPVAVADASTVSEDSGASAVPVLANDTDADGGPISIASVTQPVNGAVVITGGGTGLTYAPNANYCNNPPGTTLDTFTYTLTPGGSSTTVTVTVTCVDDNPVAVADAATVVEDSGANAIPVLTNDTDVDGGPISITSVTQPANGAVVITGGGTGLTYAPNANYCNNPPGTTLDTFTYTLTPGGSSATVTMTVTCVDDDPVAVADAATVVEDSGANAVNVLANDTDVDAGPKSIASVTQPANGAVVITGGGTGLTYAPNANYCNNPPGTTLDTFTYTLTPGGSSTTVTMTVTCVDDPPVAVADAATVNEDSGANAIPVLTNDTDVDAGPKSIASVTQPANGAVVITGGGTGLTYAPNLNYCNNPPGTTLDTFTYTLTPGGSSTTVTMTVTCVNDPPVADNDAFDFLGNTDLSVDSGALATPHALETTGTTFGVIDGDSDPVEGDAIAVSAITVGACTDNSLPLDCSDPAVGRVQMQSNGRFVFTPAAGDTGATEVFQYTLTDNGVPAPASTTATVTLTRFERVWYVKNNSAAGGLGRSADPFDTLVEAQTASFAGDYIFVYFGDGATTGMTAGIVLKNNQHLIGEHAGLSIPVNLNGNGSPTVLHAGTPGSRPLIDSLGVGGLGVSALDAIPIEIVALNLAGVANAIDLTLTGAFAGSGATEIRDNTIRSAGVEGLDVNHGGTGTLTLRVHDNTVTATGDGMNIARTAGNLVIAAFDDNVVSGNTGGSGIVISGPVLFDSDTVTANLQMLPGGVTTIGTAGNGVGGAGLVISLMVGNLEFTTLAVVADGGAALQVSGTGSFTGASGTRIAETAGNTFLTATGGPAANLSNLTSSLVINPLTSTNSASTGVNLDTVVGSFTGAAGSAISNATGTDFSINAGNATVTYNGTINDASGQAVSVTNTTGGTKSFTGSITSGSIALASNTGATMNFSGGLTLNTGATAAFSATGGGTISVTGTNTLATTTGTALNVANTIIGSSGLTFRSISSNGATNGIVLNSTGNGFLTVTGDGTTTRNNSGGTIAVTGTAISLTDVANVQLEHVAITGAGDDGVFGTLLTDEDGAGGKPSFAYRHGSITNQGNAVGDHGFDFETLSAANVTGSFIVENVLVQNFGAGAVSVSNNSGTLTASVLNSTIDNNDDTIGETAIEFRGTGTAIVNSTIQNNTLTDVEGSGISIVNEGNQANDTNVLNNQISRLGGPDSFPTSPGININVQANASVTFDVQGNAVRHVGGDGFVIVAFGSTEGRIGGSGGGQGNTFANLRTGDGVRIDVGDSTDANPALVGKTYTILVENNDIGVDNTGLPAPPATVPPNSPGVGDDGMQILHRNTGSTLNLTILNNRINQTVSEAIRYFTDQDTVTAVTSVTNLRGENNVLTNIDTDNNENEIELISSGNTAAGSTQTSYIITGNNNGGAGTFGTINITTALNSTSSITQASTAALGAANDSATVTGSPTTFNSGAANPPLPSNP